MEDNPLKRLLPRRCNWGTCRLLRPSSSIALLTQPVVNQATTTQTAARDVLHQALETPPHHPDSRGSAERTAVLMHTLLSRYLYNTIPCAVLSTRYPYLPHTIASHTSPACIAYDLPYLRFLATLRILNYLRVCPPQALLVPRHYSQIATITSYPVLQAVLHPIFTTPASDSTSRRQNPSITASSNKILSLARQRSDKRYCSM
ncbi:hypothetical protein E4U21_000358 [Claviceps maximensis]|nr:hypothetical protein E4U21_000358 [Claviceps maximensis]